MMFPRLAFVTLDNNLMILSLRSMISEFFGKYFCGGMPTLILAESCRHRQSSWELQSSASWASCTRCGLSARGGELEAALRRLSIMLMQIYRYSWHEIGWWLLEVSLLVCSACLEEKADGLW
jgi:hypothetical protein